MRGERGPAVEPEVAGLVLAAGLSSRMGRNKLLLDLEGEPLVRRTARRAIEAGLDPTIVVLGHERERVAEALAGLDVTPVVNADYRAGRKRSMQIGLDRVPETVAAAMVILADMPHVTTAMMAELVTRYRRGGGPLVVSRYGDVQAPPMLYDRSLFPELQTMEGRGCGKQVVERHAEQAMVLEWPAAALADLDTPADVERLRAHAGGRPSGQRSEVQ